MQRSIMHSLAVMGLMTLTCVQMLNAQARPSWEDLMLARARLELTFSLAKQSFFVNEAFRGQVKVKNSTSGPVTVPKLFTPGGDRMGIFEWDASEYRPVMKRIGSGVLLDVEEYSAPYPLQALAAGEEEVYSFQPLAVRDEHAPQNVPAKPGSYVVCFWGRCSPPFEVVSPSVEAYSQSLWPVQLGGDPALGVLDPIREGYRDIFSLRWQNKSSICLAIGLKARMAGVESSYFGSDGVGNVGRITCFAESTLPVTSVSGVHDGAKNLTVSYTDSQEVTRTFRVDENLSVLP